MKNDDIETLRILFGATIGELCNQERWNDAKEMEGIKDRLIQALESQSEDCISRQAVEEMIKAEIPERGMWEIEGDREKETVCEVCVDLMQKLSELPPVNTQEKTGHWVEENINEWSCKVFCSECGCSPPFEHISNGDVYSASGYGVSNKTKFCPNCGARMIEQRESEVSE